MAVVNLTVQGPQRHSLKIRLSILRILRADNVKNTIKNQQYGSICSKPEVKMNIHPAVTLNLLV
jgi:hypothetical protein